MVDSDRLRAQLFLRLFFICTTLPEERMMQLNKRKLIREIRGFFETWIQLVHKFSRQTGMLILSVLK